MKRLIAIVLVLVTLLSAIPFAQAETTNYVTWSLSTLKFLGELKDRLLVLAEKKEPTPMDVELALQYADACGRLMAMSTTELEALTNTDAPKENNSLKEFEESLEKIRLYYDLGIASGAEVISGIVSGIFGD